MLPLTPTKLGRYEIVDEIGKGAMGVVYLARDPLIGRLVALKTFRSGYSVRDPRDQEMEQFRVRFIREAQSAGILSHPNIVTIHDVVEESEDGGAFIAMEYVRGTNLKALLQGDQPLSLPFVVDVIAQVADALDYAHSNRVIHRDVKPANILITADNRVKITDFGIARIMDPSSANLTQAGQLLGTPNYMAPEQIQGKDVDYLADHFALGVVLYEMLTRHKPFQGENLTVVSHRIVYDHFTPPREYIRELPPGIEPILDKALDKDPARRYQRAKEMVDDLRRVAGALSGADLNETQSLSMMAPMLVPPALPLSPDATGSTGSTGSFGSRTPPPLPPAAHGPATPVVPASSATPAASAASPAKAPRPPSPPRSGPLVSLRRVALAGGAVALLALLAGGGGFLWLSRTTPARGRSAQEDADHARFITLVQMGSQLLRGGDQMGAANAYREAERLAPKPEKIRRLRLAAEQKASEQGRLLGVEQQKVAYLQSSQQAIESRRWEDAVNAATAGLALDPADVNLQQALAAAQTGQNRARERALAAARSPKKGQPEVVAAQTVAPPPQPPRESRPAEPVSHEATLHMTFESELSGATVIVYAGATKIWQAAIADHGGFLHRNRGGGSSGKTVQVPAGATELKVYVTPPGLAALVKTFSENFPGGASRTLMIRLPESKELSVELR